MKRILATLLPVLAAVFTAQATVYRAGLKGGFINSFDGNNYTTATIADIGVFASVEAGGVKAGSNGSKTYPPIWADNRTWRYHGQMYFDGGTYYFAESSDDAVWMTVNGTQVLKDGTWNNVGVSSAVAPTAGWHDVEIRFGNGTGGAGVPYDTTKDANGRLCGFGAVRYETAPGSKPTAMSAFTFVENTAGNVWLRVAEDYSYVTVNSIAQTANGYSFNITSSAASPATVVVYAGATAGAAEAATGWDCNSGAIAFDVNETKDIEVTGTFATPPYFVIYLSGTGTTLEEGIDVAFWEWTDIKMCTMEPTVEVALAGVTATSGTIDVTLGYDKVIAGMTAPAIALKAYYGAADAGTVAGDWDEVVDFGSANAAGTVSRLLDNLVAGGSYYVRFAAKTAESDWVWSDALSFSTGGVTLGAVPEQFCENDPTAQSFKVCRSAAATAEPLTVYLSYSGATAKVSGLPASVTLAAGEAEATVSFAMVDDNAADGDATLTIAIAENATYTLGNPSSVTVPILDDETSAGEVVWTGAGDGENWEDRANWSPMRVPTAMDTAVFTDAGIMANNATVTISSAATCYTLKISRLNAMTLDGTGSLKLGGIVREDLDGNEADHTLSVPLKIFPIDGSDFLCAVEGSGSLRLNSQSTRAMDGTMFTKTGAGLLTLMKTDTVPSGSMKILAGEVRPNVNNAVHGVIVIGGGEQAAKYYDSGAKSHNMSPHVYTNGTFEARGNQDSGGADRYEIHEGGVAIVQSIYGGIIDLWGGTLQITYRFWSGTYTQHVNANQSDTMARLTGPVTCSDYYDYSIKVQNGAQPVDLLWRNDGIHGGGTGYGFTISGAGTMQTVGGSWSTPREISMKDTTWIMDNANANGSGKGKLTVGDTATLGGIGVFGGDVTGQELIVKGSSGKVATLMPGSVETETGKHLYGTFTAGTNSVTAPVAVSLDTYSQFLIGVGPKDAETKLSPADQLKVYGTLAISAANTTLDLVTHSAARQDIAGGTYVIVEADAITGTFGTVLKPSPGWKLAYESETVDGADVVKRIILTVPEAPTLLLLR